MKKRVGKAIKQIRKKRELSQYQLAHESGISQQHISNLENGKRLPRIDVILSLANALNVTVNDILKEAQIMPGDLYDGLEAGQLYQMFRQLSDDERSKVEEFARWRLAEQRSKYRAESKND